MKCVGQRPSSGVSASRSESCPTNHVSSERPILNISHVMRENWADWVDCETKASQDASSFNAAESLWSSAMSAPASALAERWGRRGWNANVLPLPHDVVMVTSSLTPNSLAPLIRSTLRTSYLEMPNAPRFLAAKSRLAEEPAWASPTM